MSFLSHIATMNASSHLPSGLTTPRSGNVSPRAARNSHQGNIGGGGGGFFGSGGGAKSPARRPLSKKASANKLKTGLFATFTRSAKPRPLSPPSPGLTVDVNNSSGRDLLALANGTNGGGGGRGTRHSVALVDLLSEGLSFNDFARALLRNRTVLKMDSNGSKINGAASLVALMEQANRRNNVQQQQSQQSQRPQDVSRSSSNFSNRSSFENETDSPPPLLGGVAASSSKGNHHGQEGDDDNLTPEQQIYNEEQAMKALDAADDDEDEGDGGGEGGDTFSEYSEDNEEEVAIDEEKLKELVGKRRLALLVGDVDGASQLSQEIKSMGGSAALKRSIRW
jgi:hypothetical protein